MCRGSSSDDGAMIAIRAGVEAPKCKLNERTRKMVASDAKTGAKVGIALGLKSFAMTLEGKEYPNPKKF